MAKLRLVTNNYIDDTYLTCTLASDTYTSGTYTSGFSALQLLKSSCALIIPFFKG